VPAPFATAKASYALTGQTQGLLSGTRCAQVGHRYLEREGTGSVPKGLPWRGVRFQNSWWSLLTSYFTHLPKRLEGCLRSES
jgi:hypothetical protein